MVEVTVENIVFSFMITSSLDLPKLAEKIPDALYNPDEVPVLILHLNKPLVMVTLFSKGNVIVTGLKSLDEINDVVKIISDRLFVVGIQVDKTPKVNVHNITVSTDLKQPLKLRRLAKYLEFAEYTPKVFPGLIYKENDPNTVILLFDSGKIVCNGIKIEDITVALDKIIEKLVLFGIKKEEDVCQK